MFTGIVEEMGTVRKVTREGGNLRLEIECSFAGELKVDQSLAHNGACLTVEALHGTTYEVVCIEETLLRTALGTLRPGDAVNLERSLRADGRIDGHFVQGHVDETGTVREIRDDGGSQRVWIEYAASSPNVTVEKGSVCINGVSLTVVESQARAFSVAIIPYTYGHTNFRFMKAGDVVNLEFDVLGKYLQKLVERQLF